MNRIWNSIVGKLWATILLLVAFILFIVTALLLEFLGNFHRDQAEDSLRREASMIGNIVLEHEVQPLMPLLVHNILDNETNAIITDQNGEMTHTFHTGLNKERIQEEILSNSAFSTTRNLDDKIIKEMILPSITEDETLEQYIVLADPFVTESGMSGTVYLSKPRGHSCHDKKDNKYCISISLHCLYFNDFFRIFLIDKNYISFTWNEASCL